MPNAELTFADPDLDLRVRAFHVDDGLGQLFDALVTATSAAVDLDLAQLVGRPAAVRLATGDPAQPFAVWSGICCDVEQTEIEQDGASVYAVRIVPTLWRLTQRRNSRIFQHCSAVEIAEALLADWEIEPLLRLDPDSFPRHEYRVQLEETDHAFLSRTLEEAGITYLFEQADPRGAEKGDERTLPNMCLVLTDQPPTTGTRRKEPIHHVGGLDEVTGDPCVHRVRVGRSVRPGRFTVVGYDYRSSPDLRLLAEARASLEREQRYEQLSYRPECFVEEPREEEPRLGARADEGLGARVAQVELERARARQRAVSLSTNVLPLAPGVVFRLDAHPRPELTKPLLVVSRRIEGTVDGRWTARTEAAFAEDGYVPPRTAPKPRVMGVQSALVVGPRGEEIFTDSLGRVKVQFHWDRYGQRDEHSSCWIRVSQSWAGSGFGTSHVPRVGHEVLVSFFDGDPDQPVIVGRAYNRGAMPPDQLPGEETKSTWRSASVPGGEGFNEISMDDARGEEKLYLRAQRNMQTIVLEDAERAVGGQLSATVRGDERRSVGGSQRIEVARDQSTTVRGQMSTSASRGVTTQVGTRTGVHCEAGKLVLTNGNASIVLDGPNVYIDADKNMRVRSGRLLALHGKQVEVQGRPDVYINASQFSAPSVAQLGVDASTSEGAHEGEGLGPPDEVTPPSGPEAPGGVEEAEFDGYQHLTELAAQQGVDLPDEVHLPPEINGQLQRIGVLTHKGQKVSAKLLDAETYQAMRRRLDARVVAEKARIRALGRDVYGIFDSQRDHYADVAERLRVRADQERDNLAELKDDFSDIASGEKGNLLQSGKALVDVAREQGDNLRRLRADVTAMIDRELETFERFEAEWKGAYEEVKTYVDDIKQLIDDPEDAALEVVFGEDKELAEDIHSVADELGYGEEVADLFGLGGQEASEGAGEVAEGVGGAAEEAAETAPEPGTWTHEDVDFGKSKDAFANLGTKKTPGGLKKSGALLEAKPSGPGGGLKKGAGLLGSKKVGTTGSGLEASQGLVGSNEGGPTGAALKKSAGLAGSKPSEMSGDPGIDGFGSGGAIPKEGVAEAGGLGASHGAGPVEKAGSMAGAAGEGGSMAGATGAIGKGGSMAGAGGSMAGATGEAAGRVGSPSRAGAGAHRPEEGAGAAAEGSGGSFGEKVAGADGEVHSQPGGLSGQDVAHRVSPETPVVLQSPGDGQLLVVPGGEPQGVDGATLSGEMVDAQMEGAQTGSALAQSLGSRGYTVYERPWGDWWGPFVQNAGA